MGIPVAGWLSWYLPSTVVSYVQLTRYIPIMIHISMKFFTRIVNTKREVRKCNSILSGLATMRQLI